MDRIKMEGNRYGDLLVNAYLGNGKYACTCLRCGNACTTDGRNMRTGHTTSCGCKKFVDLTGRQFGRLTAIERVYKGNRIFWECQCSCGNTAIVREDCLTGGATTSCGCRNSERTVPDKLQADFVDGTQLSKIKSKPTKANKSGVVGVNWDKSRNLWQAGIRFRGKKYYLGRYADFDEAVAARKNAEKMFNEVLNKPPEGK